MNNEGKQGTAPDELVAFAGWYKIEWPPLPDDVEFFWWREFCVSAWDSAFGHTAPAEILGKIKNVTALFTADQMRDYGSACMALRQPAEQDKEARDRVARALGLMTSQRYGYAWSYLLGVIEEIAKDDPASAQPVAAQGKPVAWLVDWADIGEGTARSLYYEENTKQYMQDAVDYGQSIGRAANVTPLYTAPPPAPVAAPSPKGQP